MAKRYTPFLLDGELFDPTSTKQAHPDVPTANARASFLAAIYALAPEVASTLRSILRAGQEINPQLSDQMQSLITDVGTESIIESFYRGKDLGSIGKEYENAYAALLSYKLPLFKWAAGFNLTEDWFLASALDKLVTWEAVPTDDDKLRYAGVGEQILLDIIEVKYFEFSTVEWRCYREKESSFRERAQKAFTKELNRYIRTKKQELKEKGWQDIDEKRAPKHYDWLVRWQVQGWELSDIAIKYHRSELTIKKGLKKVAKQMGITLRKARPGRPKNKK